MIAKTIEQAFPKLSLTYVPATYVKIAKGEIGPQTFEIEYSENQINGFFQVSVFSIGNKSIAVDFYDRTDRKLAELEIRESQEKLSSYIRYAPDGIFISDENGNYVEVNPAACKLIGYAENELLKLTIPDIVFDEDLHIGLKHFATVKQNGFAKGELRFKTKDGDITYWNLSAVKLSETRFLAFVQDITDRKKAEEQLKEQSTLIRIASEKAKLGGWNVILNENRSYWSDEVAIIHEMPVGYAPLVEDGINFYAPEWRDKITQVFTDCVTKGIPYDEELEIITSTGKRVWVRTIGKPER
jgi:PAS domain S-box-containing protein